MYVRRHAYIAAGALLLIGAIVYGASWMLGLYPVRHHVGFVDLVITLTLWSVFRHWWEKRS